MSGLRLDSRSAVLKGGSRGPAALAGQPDQSLLIRAVRHESLQMPLGGKLSDSSIKALEQWVQRGLPWTPQHPPAGGGEVSQHYEAMRREHWAFQPVRDPPVPSVTGGKWGRNPIDRFILSRLKDENLSPSPAASKEVLIRRVTFVLTGLPPSPAEVAAFVADDSPDAYAKVVDRLLESPHVGEHWARHWMDVVRFGETLGNDWNYENNGAWLYRDYLIRALNGDVPYDQLVREHIAGDLLSQPRLDAAGVVNESIIGTFFFRLGEQGHDDCTMFREVRTDVVDDQIDALGKAFQGLTISCARCHDHKLDPIPTSDYYGLYGVLDSSRLVTRTADTHSADASIKARMRQLKERIRSQLADFWLSEADNLASHLIASISDPRLPSALDGSSTVLDPDRVERISGLVSGGGLELDDPLHPWAELASATKDEEIVPFRDAWSQLADRYYQHREARIAFNSDHFEVAADFANGDMGGWRAEGRAFDTLTPTSGEFSVAPIGTGVLSGIFPSGLYTHLLSEKLNGALRSPLLPRERKYLSLQVVGGKLAAWRTVLDNCMLSEHYAFLDRKRLGWIKVPLRDKHDEYRIYAELVTKHDNPRLPDRPDRAAGVTDEQIADPRSLFGVTKAVLHDCDDLPEDELDHILPLLAPGPPESLRELADRYSAIAREAVAAWSRGQASDEQARWLQWLLDNELLANSKYVTHRLREAVDRYRALERQLSAPRVIQGMWDMEPGHDTPVFESGDPENPGEIVPRGFLSLLAELGSEDPPLGSGRLEMANLIASPRNPLTSRVMVNRIWHYLFGRGLVPTVDNLGRFGERPEYPNLLDHLATVFVEDGWSIKRAIRRIVMSARGRIDPGRYSCGLWQAGHDDVWAKCPPLPRETEGLPEAALGAARWQRSTQHLSEGNPS